MRAVEILHERLADAMSFMHSARWKSLWATVCALLRGRELWLTALGRSRPGDATPKHAIKAVDRLLGNHHLYSERKRVYTALAHILLKQIARPVLLVDSTELRPKVDALTVSVAADGRSLPIYSVVTNQIKPDGRVLRRFLRDLADILPAGCRPILVSDAGFESPWFEPVEEMGWDYVGRIRNRTQFQLDGEWLLLSDLESRATNRPRNLGVMQFPKAKPKPRRIVLAKERKRTHRHRLTHWGTPGQRTQDKKCRKGARKPWVLATSLTCRPSQVVALYSLRMQIEETFRDEKCFRWGWSLRHFRSRSRARFEVALLIAAIAYIVQLTIGLASERLDLHHRHQANTIRSRRVLSLFVLGAMILHSDDCDRLTKTSLRTALTELRRKIRSLSPFHT
jgi:hypothetical protein